MKIIRLTTFLDYGGIERKMENLSFWMDDNEWIFIALGKGGVAENNIKKNKKKVYCLEYPYKIPSVKTIYRLYKIFKKERPTIVHTAGAEANFHGIIAAKLANVPVKIAEEIGISNHKTISKIIFKIIFKASDYVVGESIAVTNFLKIYYKIRENKVKTISNFIFYRDILKKENKVGNSFQLVSISRLEPVKNIGSILRVVYRLVKDKIDLKYIIVGDGVELSTLKNQVKDLGIEQYTQFVGFQNNPYQFLCQSDLYLLTSYSEGFSNSLLEAMLSNTPSLSTTVGAAEEIITDGYNGWLVPPNDDDALYVKIKHIMSLSAEQRSEIGERGHNTAKKYSLEEHINQLMKLYEKS